MYVHTMFIIIYNNMYNTLLYRDYCPMTNGKQLKLIFLFLNGFTMK